MKLTTCAVVTAVITVLFVTFGAQANSDQNTDPVASIHTEPVTQALPQEPPAQTISQPIEVEPEPSLWVSYTKNHEPIQTLLLFITAVVSLSFAERRLRIARQDALSRDTDAQTRQRDANTNSANAVATAYTQAMDQLGWSDSNSNPVIEGRLGAIYALEKIAKNNEDYREQIINVLTGYVRQHTRGTVHNIDGDPTLLLERPDYQYHRKYSLVPRLDIQTIFDVFSGPDMSWVSSTLGSVECLSFDSCFLSGVKFSPYNLRCSFAGSQLRFAILSDAIFLANSRFIGCDLTFALMSRSEFQRCFWTGAIFSGHQFDIPTRFTADRFTDLTLADIRGARNLAAEQLEGLDLSTTKRDSHVACGQPFPDGNDDPY